MTVELKAVVVKYTPEVLFDTFDNGTSVAYDGVELRIIAPQEYAGRKLVIFQSKPAAEESPWRAVGGTLRFRIEKEWLEAENRQIFTGAVEKLELLKKPEDKQRPADAGVRRQLPQPPSRERRTLARAELAQRATLERAAHENLNVDAPNDDGVIEE